MNAPFAALDPHATETHCEDWRPLVIGGDGYDARFPPLQVRAGKPGHAEAIIATGRASANVVGRLHGGFIASAAELTLFLPLYTHGKIGRGGTVTVDFALQYLASGDPDLPLHAQIELMRETGRMAFVRGVLSQNGEAINAYTGTLRKISPTP